VLYLDAQGKLLLAHIRTRTPGIPARGLRAVRAAAGCIGKTSPSSRAAGTDPIAGQMASSSSRRDRTAAEGGICGVRSRSRRCRVLTKSSWTARNTCRVKSIAQPGMGPSTDASCKAVAQGQEIHWTLRPARLHRRPLAVGQLRSRRAAWPTIAWRNGCGSFEGVRNRTTRPAQIKLAFLVVPAKPSGPSQTRVLIAGGPAKLDRSFRADRIHPGVWREARRVMLDQRGTGGSHPLGCASTQTTSRLPTAEQLRPCARSWKESPDLMQYTTSSPWTTWTTCAPRWLLADQFVAVYGTRASLDYLRRHGDRVRT